MLIDGMLIIDQSSNSSSFYNRAPKDSEMQSISRDLFLFGRSSSRTVMAFWIATTRVFRNGVESSEKGAETLLTFTRVDPIEKCEWSCVMLVALYVQHEKSNGVYVMFREAWIPAHPFASRIHVFILSLFALEYDYFRFFFFFTRW